MIYKPNQRENCQQWSMREANGDREKRLNSYKQEGKTNRQIETHREGKREGES